MGTQIENALFTVSVQQELDLEEALQLDMAEKVTLGDEAWERFNAGAISETELASYLEFLFGQATIDAPLTAEEAVLAAELAIAADLELGR